MGYGGATFSGKASERVARALGCFYLQLRDLPRVSDSDEAQLPPPPLKLAGGSEPSTEELFDRAVREHSRRLLAIARGIVGNRASPEDVVQQALLNLYQHRARYDWHEAGGLMRRAVVNEALRLLRSPRMSVVADDLPDATDDTPADDLVGRETV